MQICWDFGHAYAMFDQRLDSKYPPVNFLKKVVHCHVHDYRSGITHLPLGLGDVPVRGNLTLLKQHNFSGILNLEIVPYKIENPSKFFSLLQKSITILDSQINNESEKIVD